MISRRVIARSIADQLLSGASMRTVVPRLAAYLIEHKQIHQMDQLIGDISHEFSRRQTTRVIVTTARPLAESLRDDVIAKVRSMEAADHVELEEVVDTQLIGGIIIETPSQRFDASVARDLKQLRTVGQTD